MNQDWTVIHFDGAAEPTNPGPAAAAAIIDLPSGESNTVTIDLGVQTNADFTDAILIRANFSNAKAGLQKHRAKGDLPQGSSASLSPFHSSN